ncbi:hypothetical protein ACSTHY_00085, partial [Vibrio parahaemolyticus]
MIGGVAAGIAAAETGPGAIVAEIAGEAIGSRIGDWLTGPDAPAIRNGHLAGDVHPVTGISFDANGFP